MKKWLNIIELSNEKVKLEPLTHAHQERLSAAVKDGDLWRLWYTSAPKPNEIVSYIDKALKEYDNDFSLPFVIIEKASNKVIGTTRFMNADSIHKRIEIGTTWYAESFQRTGLNTHCKYLMLAYAFETLKCIAVEFRTHWHNRQSRNSIEKLGAKQDGVLRNHQIDKSGNFRDTVVFSIISSEWKTVKQSLAFKMNN